MTRHSHMIPVNMGASITRKVSLAQIALVNKNNYESFYVGYGSNCYIASLLSESELVASARCAPSE